MTLSVVNLKSAMSILEPTPRGAGTLAPLELGGSKAGSHAYADDPRWQLARRVAASRTLGRSRLLSEFLLYIVDRHLSDRADEITEQKIGVLVFGRAEGYDSNEDNIVRSYARNLRKRLEEYFATEGVEEGLLLEVPRGGYAPVFSPRLLAPAVTSEPAENGDGSAKPAPDGEIDDVWPQAPVSFAGRQGARRFWPVVVFCLGVALGLGCGFLRPGLWVKRALSSPAEAASHRLWRELFSSHRDSFIVPSDDGLVIMQGLTERPVPLADYINGSYRTDVKMDGVPGGPVIFKLGKRRYTSVADLDLTTHLAQLDEVVPERLMIRYARDLRMEDLRAGNAVLIGSTEANPWVQLFQPRMNFRFSIHAGSDTPSGIANTHPRAGESALYGTPGPDHTYGLIAYLPNLTSTGHVLIVAGLNTAGTEAAAKFLLSPALMMPTLQRAGTDYGGLQPFELVVGAGNVATNAATPQLIAERIGAL
jgi:hypothetical protein